MASAHSLLTLLAEGGNTGFWTYSGHTKTFFADAATCKLLGCGLAPVSNLQNLLAGVDSNERAELRSEIQQALVRRSGFYREFRLQGSRDGNRLSMRGRWSASSDAAEGEFICLVERVLSAYAQESALWKERIRSVLAQSPVTLFEQDAQLRYEWALAPRIGLQPEAFVGQRASDLLEPESARLLEGAKQAVLDSGQALRQLFHIRPKGRAGGSFDVYMAPRHGPDGQVNGVISVSIDVTELERTRQALVDSEARYRLLSEASFDGVGLAKDGIVVDANEQIARILGVPREELIGKPVIRNMLPTDTARALQAFERGGDSHNEYEYLRPDGSRVVVEVRSKDLEHGGEMLRISALRDMTQKQQQEQSLHNLQMRFAHMMQSNVVGIFIAGPDGEIFEANDYFLNLLGLSRQALEAGQLNWKTLTAPETMDVTVHSVQQMKQHGGSLPYEKEYLHADGHRVPALVALSQLSAEPVRGIVIVVDISDLKATQGELLIRNAQLLERSQTAERAEAAKALFLSSVSHELRTPLHTMLGHVRLMRKKASGEELQQLQVVEHSSTHLLRLIEDLLEYNHSSTSPERLEPELVVLDGFLESLGLIGEATTAHSDNQFFIQLGDDLPAALVVDEGRLTQVLRILMDNACKYTRTGVVIFSLSQEGERRHVDGTERCSLRFSVEDNGRGIDAADVEQIFEPLKRGSNAADTHGQGLGLAIAAQWIARMGSRIAVQTLRGIGSEFSFVLDLEVSFDALPLKRELSHSAPLAPPSSRDALSLQPLAEGDLLTLGELIHMGRLGRLRDWAVALESRCPQHREAVLLVRELAGNADLDALEALHGRWAAMGESHAG